ncbi:hypothetical protein Chor_013321 [Crotalus horridus]
MVKMAAADGEPGRMSIKEKAKLQLRKLDIGDRFSNIQLPKASVLIPLMVKDGKLCLLFTVRSMKTHSIVTPVVALIEDTFQAQPNPEEVSHVFSVPLEYFIHPRKYSVVPLQRNGHAPYLMHFFEYNDPEHQMSFTVWGLTARFAVFVAVAIYEEKPTFEVEFDLDNLNSSVEKYLMMRYNSIKSKL